MLIHRNMPPAQLQQVRYSANKSTRLRWGYYVTVASVKKIYRVLNSKVDDIIDFIPDEEQSKGKE